MSEPKTGKCAVCSEPIRETDPTPAEQQSGLTEWGQRFIWVHSFEDDPYCHTGDGSVALPIEMETT